ncbi:MAG: HD domain-containing protein [Treponema sp.]|nr:HD domain-containing protein [Treponema sp.]
MNDVDEKGKIPIKKVKKYVRSSVSKKRYEHSMRTAKMCRTLCSLYGLDKDKGFFAGLSHDMCKGMVKEDLICLVKRDKKGVSEIENENPLLLHGRAAAVLLEEKFDFHDKDVIEAVANHTLGKGGMCALAKVLYAADKIEPGREHITKPYLKKLYRLPLDALVKTVLQENIAYLHRKGRKTAYESEEFLKSLDGVEISGDKNEGTKD